MTPESRKFLAADAKALLENKLFNEAFDNVEAYIDTQALACDPDNKDKTQRIVISKQLLAAVKREIFRIVEDGAIAEVEMIELERKSRPFKFLR